MLRCRRTLPTGRTDAKVFGGRLEERVFLGLGRLAGTERRSSGLLGSGLLGGLVIETKSATRSLEVNVEFRSSNVVHGMQRPRRCARFIARRGFN